MVFLYIAVAFVVTWCLAAIMVWRNGRTTSEALLWIAAVLALGTVAAFGYGAVGLLRFGDWQAISTGQALHWLFGEGSLALRRSGWPRVNRAAGIYLNLDIAWTLLALCAIQFQSITFWSRVAETMRRERRQRTDQGPRSS